MRKFKKYHAVQEKIHGLYIDFSMPIVYDILAKYGMSGRKLQRTDITKI